MKIHSKPDLLFKIREKKPLILNISNAVTMDWIANGLLSLGASPIMTLAEEELEDLLNLSAALVINLGTLNETFIQLCRKACQIAKTLKKPIILDPVGAGASQYRTQTALALLKSYPIQIIKGNAAEIMALSGMTTESKGVDTDISTEQAIEAAKQLAQTYHTCIVVSGAIDRIFYEEHFLVIEGGSAWMKKITGSGCLLTAVIATFYSQEPDPLIASEAALNFYNHAAENAALKSKGPGSFKMHFIDELSSSGEFR